MVRHLDGALLQQHISSIYTLTVESYAGIKTLRPVYSMHVRLQKYSVNGPLKV